MWFTKDVVASLIGTSSSACQLIASSLWIELPSDLMLERRGLESRRFSGISRLYACFSSGDGDRCCDGDFMLNGSSWCTILFEVPLFGCGKQGNKFPARSILGSGFPPLSWGAEIVSCATLDEDLLSTIGLLKGLPRLWARLLGDDGTTMPCSTRPARTVGDRAGLCSCSNPKPETGFPLTTWIGGGNDGDENTIEGVRVSSGCSCRRWRRWAVYVYRRGAIDGGEDLIWEWTEDSCPRVCSVKAPADEVGGFPLIASAAWLAAGEGVSSGVGSLVLVKLRSLRWAEATVWLGAGISTLSEVEPAWVTLLKFDNACRWIPGVAASKIADGIAEKESS